jgi:hypothetical protein
LASGGKTLALSALGGELLLVELLLGTGGGEGGDVPDDTDAVHRLAVRDGAWGADDGGADRLMGKGTGLADGLTLGGIARLGVGRACSGLEGRGWPHGAITLVTARRGGVLVGHWGVRSRTGGQGGDSRGDGGLLVAGSKSGEWVGRGGKDGGGPMEVIRDGMGW